MRYVYAILLILFLGLILIFSIQNLSPVKLEFLTWVIEMPLAALIVGAYLLGMVSGWSVLGFVRHSLRRVREHERPQA